ncbi:hypothetical protein OC861_001204 [Tilletia horrida]|nr:hypothetical protein OC845_001337 [Tilletia horrida]KAK0569168.1 hypothetical protein OC861_001204 [Tilletia horrida]
MPQQPEVYDLLGIGFGPANLSLAISLIENEEAQKRLPRIHFLERQPHFAWHPTLLLPGASLQVSPLKDLATMRDPTSSFSFTNYLHQTDRLASFINKENQVPSRREWSAYLTWAARRMDDYVTYDQAVVSIEPVFKDGAEAGDSYESVRYLKVTSRFGKTGQVVERLARNITIGVGGTANIPESVSTIYPADPWSQPSQIIHSSTFLPSLSNIDANLRHRIQTRSARTSPIDGAKRRPLRLAVMGSGQSAAEMTLHLYHTYPQAHVTMIFRATAIVPSDDSAFVNAAAFDPERTDTFWQASEKQRSAWRKEFRRTNYSVVRPNVLNELHTIVYDQQIELPSLFPGSAGPSEGYLEIKSNTTVLSSQMVKGSDGDEIELHLSDGKNSGSLEEARFDAVFIGTGFSRSPRELDMFRPVAKYFAALDPNSTIQTTMSGSSTPELGRDEASEMEDAAEAERARERQRGIARDYRLVSYADTAYAGRTSVRRSSASSDSPVSSRSSSVGALSALSSSSTLNESHAALPSTSSKVVLETPNVYLMGCNEATHGLSDSLLSIVAWRAGEITDSLLHNTAAPADDATITKADQEAVTKIQPQERSRSTDVKKNSTASKVFSLSKIGDRLQGLHVGATHAN